MKEEWTLREVNFVVTQICPTSNDMETKEQDNLRDGNALLPFSSSS
jgi:hypothetical protein